ncbi:MAG: hypothetical protein WA102_12865 [Candidatus Methanoperedens sp.]
MKHFLIYIDSLGYEKKAKEEAKNTGRPVEDIRESYIGSIEGRLKELKKREFIKSYKKSEYGDDFVVFTDSIWNAFKTIGEVLKAKLTLAIGIGFLKVDDLYLIERSDETISNLKTYIIPKYKKFYEDEHGEHSLTQTFILFTPEAYQQLDSKRKCSKPYPSADFYFIEQKEFERELKVLEFLEKIGSQRAEYREIEELYVEPQNYDKIKRILEENNIVFIIGDAEMGKTYTAIKLLFEYSKDYEPIYIPEERKREQWEFIRHKTDFEGKAIYLEDPWGKVEFETAESLFTEIGHLFEMIKRTRCKIIITSREKVFNEFKERKEFAEDLRKYVIPLKVNLSYSKENLKNILEKYIDVFEPIWAHNLGLRLIAFKAAEAKLRTPMSIRKLIESSKDVRDFDSLHAVIEKAAEETKIVFAREIKEIYKKGEYDKLVFLSFAYIGVETNIAKLYYKEILKDLGYDLIKAKDFDEIMEESKEVEILYILRYIHPSYEDAFGLALTDADKPNNICKNIFSKVLLKLSEKGAATERIAISIADNFDKLPYDVRNKLLLKLSENKIAAKSFAITLTSNFDQIVEDIRNKLLLNISENSETAWIAARFIMDNFDKLPEDLLLKISSKDKAAWGIAKGITDNFDKFPERIRYKLLQNLTENSETVWIAARIIADNFDKLPEDLRNLLFELSKKDNAATMMVWPVTDNFDKLPEEGGKDLLMKFSENYEAAGRVVWAIVTNFDKIPKDIGNKILLMLSEKDGIARNMACALADNFEKFPEDIRNKLLLKLSEKKEATIDITRAVINNFDKLPKDIREKLLL